VENSNIDSIGIPERPLTILNTSMRSALLRLSSKLQSPKRLSPKGHPFQLPRYSYDLSR